MATQLAPRRDNPVAVFRQTLGQMTDQLKMALPAHISVDKFQRVATTAVQTSPALLDSNKVDRHSLFGALVKAAQDGLLPDGREGAIVPYKGKAQWQPMVAGIMKKVRQSGEVASWDVAAVYEKDEFERLLGDDQRIYHKPYAEGDPGKVIGAYSIVTLKDGSKSRDYMPRWRIEKARAQGMAKDSLMWSQFYDEGAIKTVIKHHSKRLPMATDIDAAFERDETMVHVEESAVRIMDGRHGETQSQPMSRLDALEHQIGADEPDEEIADSEQGRPDEDMGEAHGISPDDLIGHINAKVTAMDVNSLVSSWKDAIDGFDADDRARVAQAQHDRISAIKAKAAA